MNTLFWFNPENDLALAAGSANYTPPAAAVALRQGGVRLPQLWCDRSDLVLDIDLQERISNPTLIPEPWGWSAYTRNRLLRAGACAQNMPDDDALAHIRRLSHRRTSVELLRGLGVGTAALPVEAFTESEALRAIDSMDGDAVVKLPWSCSGRGVFYTRKMSRGQLQSVVKGGITRQGSVMIERRLDKVADFAMLFYCDGPCVTYRGLSVFATDVSGNYSGNLIASQSILAERIDIDCAALGERISYQLGQILDGRYRGWIGVDMMICRSDNGHTFVHPCVEVNLRMTMGVAALLAAQSGRLPWDVALLRVALPGEMLPHGAITLSATEPDRRKPVRKPIITVNNAENRS